MKECGSRDDDDDQRVDEPPAPHPGECQRDEADENDREQGRADGPPCTESPPPSGSAARSSNRAAGLLRSWRVGFAGSCRIKPTEPLHPYRFGKRDRRRLGRSAWRTRLHPQPGRGCHHLRRGHASACEWLSQRSMPHVAEVGIWPAPSRRTIAEHAATPLATSGQQQ